MQIWTIGHSNQPLRAFLLALVAHQIALVADVRRFPASRRHPHFGRLWLRWGGGARWGLAPSSLAGMGADISRAMALQAGMIERAQIAGELRSGDPNVLAHIFSGMIQSYQATDPASVGETGDQRLTLADLHAIIEGAFAP